MGGDSGTQDCPNCGGRDTMQYAAEFGPFDTFNADCLACGFQITTKVRILSTGGLRTLRRAFEDDPDLPHLYGGKDMMAEYGIRRCRDRPNLHRFTPEEGRRGGRTSGARHGNSNVPREILVKNGRNVPPEARARGGHLGGFATMSEKDRVIAGRKGGLRLAELRSGAP